MKTRGPKRLASINYGTLARWTGMAEGSIRNAVNKGRLELDGIDSLIRWANERRAAKGLPPVGDPSEPPPAAEAPPADIETASDPPVPNQDAQPVSATATPHTPSCRCHSCYLRSKTRPK